MTRSNPAVIPHATLITGPVGCGKTARALDAIITLRRERPFAPVWVLLASQQQAHTFQERLIRRAGAVLLGVETFTFEDLYARVLDLLGDPQRLIDETARYQILRHVTARLSETGQLALFGGIAHLPGFISTLAGLLHELKQGMVEPDDFVAVAQTRGDKDRDLAAIYRAYQRFLHAHKLIDRHGAGWLAVEHLRAGERALAHVPDLLVVDGFDQFNQVHAHLVTQLAQLVPRTLLTLTAAPDQPGRYFRRFERTRAALLELAPSLWQIETLTAPPDARAGVLDALVDQLFTSGAQPVPGDETIALIEAPDVGREVSAVLRRIKWLLLGGAAPDSIAVITRDLSRYGGPLRETARAYGVPLIVREGVRLRENPAVALVLALLDLHRYDFPRRDVLDVLRSPYLNPPGLTEADSAWLERISLARQVVRGRGVWLNAVRSAGRAFTDEDGDTRDLLDEAGAEALAGRLAQFFERITPPKSGTVYAYVQWIEALLGPDPEADAHDHAEGIAAGGDAAEVAANGPDTGVEAAAAAGEAVPTDGYPLAYASVIACARATPDAAYVARDINALRALLRVLHGLRSTHDLLGGDPAPLRWDDFRKELQSAVDTTTIVPPGGFSRLGRVLATTVLEARGLPHDHVFILGLAEGVFPAPERDSGLYQEHERAELEAASPRIDMLTAGERPDDMSLFYQAVGLARESLTLSRFTVDDKGTQVPASPYWRAVRTAVDVPDVQIERVRVGAVPTLDAAATLSEAAVALAALWSGEHTPGALDPAMVHNALLTGEWAACWRSVLHGRALEVRREDPARPFDHYDGAVRDPALLDAIAAQLGPAYHWSASQLNDYGVCAFRFFARRLLKLEELEEPEEGLDALQFGSLNHAILEETYRRIAEEGLTITEPHQERALAILREEAARIFDTAPREFGFSPGPVWEAERDALLRRLEWLVALDFSQGTPLVLQERQKPDAHPVAAALEGAERIPYRQEAAFGLGDSPALDLNPGGEPVWVRGVIDRIDRAGDRLILMDYKTGSTRHPVKDMQAGRDFQMMVYLLAAREALALDPELDVLGGLFWHIRSRDTSGEVLADHAAVEQARELARQGVAAARQGRFIVQPHQGRCAPYCEFQPLCRLGRAHHLKTATGGWTEGT